MFLNIFFVCELLFDFTNSIFLRAEIVNLFFFFLSVKEY